MVLAILMLVTVALALLMFYLPRWRLKKVLNLPFSQDHEAILISNIPVYKNMPEALQAELKQLIKRFLYEKDFIGCADLEVTDEIRVTIAAEACMLLLNRPTDVYAGLRAILVYPAAFIANRNEMDMDGVVSAHERGLLGESWNNGRVILAWDHVLQGAKNFSDGQNVVLHEFAHQLDAENGTTNGAPLLGGSSAYSQWAAVFSREFTELQKQQARHHKSLIDQYGATNPAEFFAVATETFFEKPEQLAREHQALYAQLQSFYRIDPRDWLE